MKTVSISMIREEILCFAKQTNAGEEEIIVHFVQHWYKRSTSALEKDYAPMCDSRGRNFDIIIIISSSYKYWRQGHKSIHFLKEYDTWNFLIVTDCCNNQEFLRKSQKLILIYCLEQGDKKRKKKKNLFTSPCLEKREQSIDDLTDWYQWLFMICAW